MEMVERKIGMVVDGFDTCIDFALAKSVDYKDTKVKYASVLYPTKY
jgi:hypothetical protein